MGILNLFKKSNDSIDKKVYKSVILNKRDKVLNSPTGHTIKIRPAGETFHQKDVERLSNQPIDAKSVIIKLEECQYEGETAFKIFIMMSEVGYVPKKRIDELKKHIEYPFAVKYIKFDSFQGDEGNIIHDVVFSLVFEK